MNEHTLSVPLRLQYRYEIIKDLSVFLYTGASFDYSLAYGIKMTYGGETKKVNLYEMEESDMNRFNVYWGVGAGVRYGSVQFTIGGDWGITKLYPDSETVLNKPVTLSVSYLF